MSDFVVTRIRRNPKDGTDCQPVPVKADGTRYTWACRYAGSTKTAWSDCPSGLVSAITGEPDYCGKTAQAQCVVRIKAAYRIAVLVQATLLQVARENGDYDRILPAEMDILLAPRYEQPAPEMPGFNIHLFGVPVWSAPCPLVLVSDGYLDRPLPRGADGLVWYLEAGESDESFLESLDAYRIVEVLHVADDIR